jgi:hypothetical protein
VSLFPGHPGHLQTVIGHATSRQRDSPPFTPLRASAVTKASHEATQASMAGYGGVAGAGVERQQKMMETRSRLQVSDERQTDSYATSTEGGGEAALPLLRRAPRVITGQGWGTCVMHVLFVVAKHQLMTASQRTLHVINDVDLRVTN